MPYIPIHDYGLIGDRNSCALVSREGSIDWACFPRFDSPSSFAAVLDDVKGGRCAIEVRGGRAVAQRYVPETTVLEATFESADGVAQVSDFMTHAEARNPEAPHEIIRIVTCISGSPTMRLAFQPRLDYARGETKLRRLRSGVMAEHKVGNLGIVADLPFSIEDAEDGGQQATAEFTMSTGDTVHIAILHNPRRLPGIQTLDCRNKLLRVVRRDRASITELRYDGYLRDEVVRSYLTLRLLMYSPTGAIVAAPTTSLPEAIGGGRNWDYRFSWLRDSAWTLGILQRIGGARDGQAYLAWTVKECQMGLDSMQILYGIHSESTLTEITLDHLEGYRGSRPVRIGNDAAFHRQLDVFGEVALTLSLFHRFSGALPPHAWQLFSHMADLAAGSWRMPDRGIWEVRGQEQHFVYSKVMCWVALDRAVRIGEAHGYDGDIARWRAERDLLRDEILEQGWSEEKQSFVQAYGTEALDASALLIAFVDFLPIDDPRLRSTIRRIQQELADGPFVRRYRVDETDDGLEGEEGAFYILTFWLIGALLMIGETEEALKYFDMVSQTANHLGLFAEMYDPHTGEGLGNFPQAFSHIGFLHTARNVNAIMRRNDDYDEELQA